MRTFATAFFLWLAGNATNCDAQSTLRDATNWTHAVLIDSDTSGFAERLFWADSILASQPAEAAMHLADVLHLFPSFQQADSLKGKLTLEELELLWFAARFEVQNREQLTNPSDSPLPFAAPAHSDSATAPITRTPWAIGLAAAAAIASALAWARERRKKSAPEPTRLSPDLQKVFERMRVHPTPKACRIDLINLAFEQGRHPVQLAMSKGNRLRDLSPSEIILSAFLHDNIEMDAIELAMQKSRGTLYNMRSQIRKKLAIAESADLTSALRLLCKP